MESLNLTQQVRRSDGWLKSIFWPSVDNAWDVNYLGQQGFWICLLVAAGSLLLSFFGAQPIVLAVGILGFLFYVLGAMAVREGSWPAAAMVCAAYVVNLHATVASGRSPGIVAILFAAVLFSNLRAAFLASEWKPIAEGEDSPTRFSDSFADKLVDQLPPRLWPLLQIPFYALGILLLLLSLAGLASILARRLGLLPHPLVH